VAPAPGEQPVVRMGRSRGVPRSARRRRCHHPRPHVGQPRRHRPRASGCRGGRAGRRSLRERRETAPIRARAAGLAAGGGGVVARARAGCRVDGSREIDTPMGPTRHNPRGARMRGGAPLTPCPSWPCVAVPVRGYLLCPGSSGGVSPMTCTPAPLAMSMASMTSPYSRFGAVLMNNRLTTRWS